MMPTLRFIACAAVLTAAASYAQNLPDAMYLSSDDRMLYTDSRELTDGLYREDTIRTLELTFAQPNWWTLLEDNYDSQTPIPATMTFDGQVYDQVGVRFKGSTSYFALPPGTEKMSFDIKMDEYVPGQDVKGYESMNLNNSFQDNSFMREVVYEHMIRRHIPGAKANYVKLVINGENWGLYPNVQGLDGAFLKEWWFSNDGNRWRADRPPGSPGPGGMWGDGTAALNYLGPDTSDYQDYYTLQKANTPNPWDQLVRVCDKLNNTSAAQLRDTMNKYMDLDRVLWFLACENVFADDDSYIFKGKMDYCLYWDPETGRMTTQEYDGNTILEGTNVNWSPFYHVSDVNYPLLNRLLNVPELRQRYLAHLRTVMADGLDATTASQVITGFQTMIDTVVQNDPKKLMTYAQWTSAVPALTSAFTSRRNTLNANAEVVQVAPTISGTEHEVGAGVNEDPAEYEAVHVRTTVSSGSGIYGVTLYWSQGVYGRFKPVTMFDDGAHDDGGAGDGVYGATIPGVNGGNWVRYYIEAAANNTAHSVRYDPIGAEHDVYVYKVAFPAAPVTGVVINEVMADNNLTATDEAGQFEDWIELHNNSGSQVDLGLWFVSDSYFEPYKWRLPIGTSIPSNGYLIIWADEDESQGDTHTNFKLSDQGESALILTDDSLLVDVTDFDAVPEDMGWARVPNGTGPFVVQQPTFAANNNFVGVAEVIVDDQLMIFPNPASTVLAMVNTSPGTVDVSITDATGRQQWTGRLTGRERVDVSTWAPGSYVVRAGDRALKLMVAR